MDNHQSKTALVIINPRAGRRQRKIKLSAMLLSLAEHGYLCRVHHTRGRGDATNLAARYGPDASLVVCLGGDGTLGEVITGLIKARARVPIGFIPAGSTNDVARTLGIPLNPSEALRSMLTGAPHCQDMGRFGEDSYFTYIASFGAFTDVAYATPQWLKNRLGYWAYILYSAKQAVKVRPISARIVVDGAAIQGKFLFGGMINSTSVGKLMKLDPKSISLNDGLCEVMLVSYPQNPLELFAILKSLISRKYDPRYVRFYHARQAEFAFEEEVPWTVDGEFAGEYRSVQTRVLPCCYFILRESRGPNESLSAP